MTKNEHRYFILYRGTRNHFLLKKYDAFKYNFRTNGDTDIAQLERSKDYNPIVKCTKWFDINEFVQYVIFGLVSDQTILVRMLNLDQDKFKEWNKVHQAISYYLLQSCARLKEEGYIFNDLFEMKEEYPLIIKEYLENRLSFLELSLLNKLTGFVNRVKVSETILWPPLKHKLSRHLPFLVDIEIGELKKNLIKLY